MAKNKSKRNQDEKGNNKKGGKLYVKCKGYDNAFNSWIDKIRHYIHFPKLHDHFGGNVKVDLDLLNYARKGDLKGASGIDASNFASKSN